MYKFKSVWKNYFDVVKYFDNYLNLMFKFWRFFLVCLLVVLIFFFVNKVKLLNFEILICINFIFYKYNVNKFVNNVNISFFNIIIFKYFNFK